MPSCDTVAFPRQEGCPRCLRRPMTDVALPERGVIWSWTVQHFPPKPPYRTPPSGFAPFAVGYVDLDGVLVESRLQVPVERLRIGLPVRLAATPPEEAPFAFEEVPDGE